MGSRSIRNRFRRKSGKKRCTHTYKKNAPTYAYVPGGTILRVQTKLGSSPRQNQPTEITMTHVFFAMKAHNTWSVAHSKRLLQQNTGGSTPPP